MKRYNYIFSIIFGAYIYTILSFTFGPTGIYAMNQLNIEKNKVLINKNDLNLINLELVDFKNNLDLNNDTIAIYAHELGYISEGEGLIKLANYKGGVSRNFNAGFVLKANEIFYLPEWFCKLASIICSFMILIVLIIQKIKLNRKEIVIP